MKTPPILKDEKAIKTFSPIGTEDCFSIINYVKEKPALVSLISTDKAVKQRIIDVLCGACTALNLGLCLLDKNNILIVKK